MEASTCKKLKMRLLLTFLKRKLENGRVKSVHVDYVKRTFNMQGLFERTIYTSYYLPLHFYLHFSYAFYDRGGG